MIIIFSVPKSQNSNEGEKNSVTAKEYLKYKNRSKKPSCNWLIMLVTMAVPISS